MMHPPPATVRLDGRNGLLAAIPTSLGFHPTDSVVIVALAGPRRRIGPVVRANITTAPTTAEATALIGTIAHTIAPFADDTALVIYTDHPGELDLKTAAKPLMALCPLMDAAVVPNRPNDIPADLMAATIGSGRRVLTSRQELAQSIEYRPGTGHRPSAFSAFDNVAARDAYIQSAMGRPEILPVLIASAQKTPDDDSRVANLCAALAFLAYHSGDGALAQVAVDRVLRVEPRHRLAHLLLVIMASGVPPQTLDHVAW